MKKQLLLSKQEAKEILNRSIAMKKLILLAVLLVSFTACNYYDAFPPAMVSYFPYAKKQKLTFKNENGCLTSLTVNEMYVSKKHSQYWGVKCGGADMRFSAQNDTMTIQGNMNIPCMSNGAGFALEIFLSAGNVEYWKDYSGDAYSDQMLSEIGDTIRFTNDDKEAIVVRHEGVIQFFDKQRNCTWTLIK